MNVLVKMTMSVRFQFITGLCSGYEPPVEHT